MPPEQTLRLIRAQDLTLRASLSPPREVTGWSITFQVRDSLGGTSRITKTVGSGITLTDAGKGIITISLAKADTATLTIQSYVWDVKRTDSGNNVVLARGQLVLEQEVTS
jgi:hypothetical protein